VSCGSRDEPLVQTMHEAERASVNVPVSINPQCKREQTSVIIPAYNCADSIHQAVESALAQTRPPFEVIIIDDGSTDSTLSKVRAYGAKVTLLTQPNSGPASARNLGVRTARGQFIAFLDADDYWEKDFLHVCTDVIRKHPGIVAVSTGLRFRLPDGTERIGPRLLLQNRPPVDEFIIEDFFSFWAEADHIRVGSCVIRRSALMEAGLMNARLRQAEDLELWALLATYGKWAFTPKILWVGNSDVVAARQGWLRKYRTRWSFCPSMSEWTRRISPRIRPDDVRAFERACGRVAVSFARSNLLAGNYRVARDLVDRYRSSLPNSLMGRLLKTGSALGLYPFSFLALLIKAREYQKALNFAFRKIA
jgi:glycosyltransferase involved in cell wall biosynthesis